MMRVGQRADAGGLSGDARLPGTAADADHAGLPGHAGFGFPRRWRPWPWLRTGRWCASPVTAVWLGLAELATARRYALNLVSWSSTTATSATCGCSQQQDPAHPRRRAVQPGISSSWPIARRAVGASIRRSGCRLKLRGALALARAGADRSHGRSGCPARHLIGYQRSAALRLDAGRSDRRYASPERWPELAEGFAAPAASTVWRWARASTAECGPPRLTPCPTARRCPDCLSVDPRSPHHAAVHKLQSE